MVDQNIQILDLQNNNLFPKTKTSVVINSNGEAIQNVEPNAQVNIIETISVNGVALNVVSKGVNIEIPEGAEYTVVKQGTPESGYSATYQLIKNGVATGEKINIPKDLFVQSGTVETVTEADTPYTGAKVGDLYIDLVLANSDNDHIYIPVNSLVDIYTEGGGINITGQTVSVDLDYLKQTFAQTTTVNAGLELKADKATTLAGYGITDTYTKSEVYTQSETDNKISTAVGALNYLTYQVLA